MTSQALTRRLMLAGAGTAIAAPALAVPVVGAATTTEPVCSLPLDPVEQFEAALAEYRAAAMELVPSINDWIINRTPEAVVVVGLTSPSVHTVSWDGPGVYELANPPAGGTCWQVTRAPQYDSSGERWFGLSTGFKKKHEPEDWFCPERNRPKLVRKVRSIDLTAQQRADVHLADYRHAMQEVDPTITGWGIAYDVETGGLHYVAAQRSA
jgi:hypothetical protein